MKPSDHEPAEFELPASVGSPTDAETDTFTDGAGGPAEERNDWQLWPPAPKVQIVLIAMAFGVFNLILLAIWAMVMVYRF